MTGPTFPPQNDPVQVTFPVLEPYEPPTRTAYQQEPPAPAEAPQHGRKTAVIVLSVLLVLFLSTAGAFGVLYFDQKAENSRITEQVAKKDVELAASAKKVKDSGDDLTKAKSATKIAEDARLRAEDEAKLSSSCREAARKLREAVLTTDDAKAQEALKGLFTAC
jgi:uncharacterized protein HemX